MVRLYLLLSSSFLAACLGAGPIYLGGADVAEGCRPNFEERAVAFLERGGMAASSTFFPAGEALDQELRYPGTVCAEQAMLIAVDALIASRRPESLGEVSRAIGLPECEARCYFNRKTSLFGLVADRHSSLRSRLLPLPPAKDSVSDSWVFFLSVPDLDEHGYWALVSRDGGAVVTMAEN
jgi:hypothetical protein